MKDQDASSDCMKAVDRNIKLANETDRTVESPPCEVSSTTAIETEKLTAAKETVVGGVEENDENWVPAEVKSDMESVEDQDLESNLKFSTLNDMSESNKKQIQLTNLSFRAEEVEDEVDDEEEVVEIDDVEPGKIKILIT